MRHGAAPERRGPTEGGGWLVAKPAVAIPSDGAGTSRHGPMMPTLFVSHGAPTVALRPDGVAAAWRRLAAELPRPRAVLVVSAHWPTVVPTVGAAEMPVTLHDFYGFPSSLYRLRYPAPGAPDLARRVAELLRDDGLHPARDTQRGLDHGAWVPLSFLLPEAKVPVAQLSIQPALGAAHHLRLGEALRVLPAEGVLVLASGQINHNLGELRWNDRVETPAWVEEFVGWMSARLTAHDTPALLAYRALAPHAARNHPSEEHLLPLYTALGAAGEGAAVQHIAAGVQHGVLAMDAFRFDPA